MVVKFTTTFLMDRDDMRSDKEIMDWFDGHARDSRDNDHLYYGCGHFVGGYVARMINDSGVIIVRHFEARNPIEIAKLMKLVDHKGARPYTVTLGWA